MIFSYIPSDSHHANKRRIADKYKPIVAGDFPSFCNLRLNSITSSRTGLFTPFALKYPIKFLIPETYDFSVTADTSRYSVKRIITFSLIGFVTFCISVFFAMFIRFISHFITFLTYVFTDLFLPNFRNADIIQRNIFWSSFFFLSFEAFYVLCVGAFYISFSTDYRKYKLLT